MMSMDPLDIVFTIAQNADGTGCEEEFKILTYLTYILDYDTNRRETIDEALFELAKHHNSDRGYVNDAYRVLRYWEAIMDIRDYYGTEQEDPEDDEPAAV